MEGTNGNTHRQLTLGSLFDGSGGFPYAGILAGIKPVFNCEVEPFAIRVTTKRMPDVKHYGDISALNGAELPPVDIITGGFPCQSVSIAGKREGVQHVDHGGETTTRSGLFYEAVRIIKEMREKTNGEKPRFFVVENVPGLFSSKGGEDFKAVLEEIIRIKEPETPPVPPPEKGKWPYADCYLGDGWSLAYRVLDAQYWGVPQRRARIFLVADFAGERAPEILFKSEGVSRYSAESFRQRKSSAGNLKESAGAAGREDERGRVILNNQGGSRMDVSEDVVSTLRAEAHHPPVVLDEHFSPTAAGFCTEHSANARSIGYEEETSPTLRAGVVPATVYENHIQDSRCTGPLDVAPTVNATYGMGGNNQPFVVDELPPQTLKIRSGCEGGGKGPQIQVDKSATLGCNNDQTVFVPYGVCSKHSHSMLSDNPNSGFYEAYTARTLDQNGGRPDCSQGGIAIVEVKPEAYDVRFTSDGTKNARGHCYKTDISRCLDTSEANPDSNHGGVWVVEEGKQEDTFPAVAFTQNQRNEVRDLNDVAGASAAEPGMKQQTYVLQGSMIGRSDKNGPQGDGVNEDVSFTLDTSDRHAVAYCMTTGSFMQVQEEKAPTLAARDFKDPPVVNRKRTVSGKDVFGTLTASMGEKQWLGNQEAFSGDYHILETESYYIVRRLTPTECARLQGFPDNWCADLGTEDPTDEEVAFWTDVFETHRKVVTGAKKPKTEKQIRKWLADPYSDSAEYRLWGNGVSLPICYFVLSGIVWAAGLDEE